jgi:hypothetical protein
MEPEGLLPTLQEPTTCPYTKADIITTVRIKECIQFYYSHNIQHQLLHVSGLTGGPSSNSTQLCKRVVQRFLHVAAANPHYIILM